MKILLLGEFSGLHDNLKDGLQELGYNPSVYSFGDGWKGFEPTLRFPIREPGLVGLAVYRMKMLLVLLKIKKFNVVQSINPFILPSQLFPYRYVVRKLIKSNSKVFLLAAGCDAYFWKFGKNFLRYGPFEDVLKFDYSNKTHMLESERAFAINKFLASKVDGIIPVMYEYARLYNAHEKLREVIPLPINTKKIPYMPNKAGRRLVVFHGLNRYGFKGTRHVEEAFNILKRKYPEDLELIIDGKMPLPKYLELMSRANVVIDQTNSYSCGMNALYAMAMGKIVLGGAEPESLVALKVKYSPVYNILPTAESIVSGIELILEKKAKLEDLGFKSRKFVEEVHGHVCVAKKYIETWFGKPAKPMIK